MPKSLKRALITALWLACLLPAAPSAALIIRGRALGPGGPLPGVLASDGHQITQSDASGRFSLASRPGRVFWLASPPGFQIRGRWWWPAQLAAASPLAPVFAKAPPAKTHRVLLVSDPHLPGPEDKNRALVPAARAGWQRALAIIAKHRPGLTIVAGDVCANLDKLAPAQTGGQIRAAAAALAQLPAPWRALPGNHDVVYRQGVDDSLWRQHLGPTRQAFFLGQTCLILLGNNGLGLDPGGRPASRGGAGPEALAWLKQLLAQLPRATPLVLVTHYPLLSPLTGAVPFYPRALVSHPGKPGLAIRDLDQNAQSLFRLLLGRKVVLFISGHEHAAGQWTLHHKSGPWRFLGLPALSGGWWRGDRRLGPLRFPPGLVVLTLGPGPPAWQFLGVGVD